MTATSSPTSPSERALQDIHETEHIANGMLALGAGAIAVSAVAELVDMASSNTVVSHATETTAMVALVGGGIFLADGLYDRIRAARQRRQP